MDETSSDAEAEVEASEVECVYLSYVDEASSDAETEVEASEATDESDKKTSG